MIKSTLPPNHGDQHLSTGSDPIPGLDGFIRYDFENVGDWLYIETTDSDSLTNDFGMKLLLSAGLKVSVDGSDLTLSPDLFAFNGDVPINFFTADGTIQISNYGSGDFMSIESGDYMTLLAVNNIDIAPNADLTMSVGGDITAVPGGNVSFKLQVGKTFTLKDHSNNPKIRWTEGTSDLHIPTGGTVVADL